MQRRGESNLGTWGLLAALVAAIYSLILFGPAFVDNLSVREQMTAATTLGFSAPEDVVQERIVSRCNGGESAVGYHFEESDDGTLTEVRGLGLTAENVAVYKDESTRTMTITVDYTRRIRLFPSQKYTTLHFRPEKEMQFQ